MGLLGAWTAEVVKATILTGQQSVIAPKGQLADNVFRLVTNLDRHPGCISRVLFSRSASMFPFPCVSKEECLDPWMTGFLRGIFLQARLLGRISLAENECLVSSLQSSVAISLVASCPPFVQRRIPQSVAEWTPDGALSL